MKRKLENLWWGFLYILFVVFSILVMPKDGYPASQEVITTTDVAYLFVFLLGFVVFINGVWFISRQLVSRCCSRPDRSLFGYFGDSDE